MAAAVEKGTLDKKNPLGIWTKKFVKLDGLQFTVSDSEDGAPLFQASVSLVTRGGDGQDPLSITVHGEKQGESINLKSSDVKVTANWYDMLYRALERGGRARPRNAGLPARDPRFDLPFIKIPPEFSFSFTSLETAVIYWFGAITKYGTVHKLTRKPQTESRILFIGDKCLYVTKDSSEVTRCMKMAMLASIYTNFGDAKAPANDHFVVFKMKPPEYDLHVSGANMAELINVVSVIFKHMAKGLAELPVHTVPTATDPKVALQLQRPEGFEMTMVRPVTKAQLKQALDAFGAKHGITFAPADPVPPPAGQGGLANASFTAAGTSAAGQPPSAPEQPKAPVTDHLAVFLSKLSLEQYYAPLSKQNIDIDVMECMDDADMKNFGLKDPATVKLIRDKMADAVFMQQVRDEVDNARKEAKWVPKRDTPQSQGAPASSPQPLPQQTPQPPAPAPAPQKVPIILDDDDDFLVPAASPKGQINMAICLDSDDDLDIAPKPKAAPATAPAKKPIDLDDDDI